MKLDHFLRDLQTDSKILSHKNPDRLDKVNALFFRRLE